MNISSFDEGTDINRYTHNGLSDKASLTPYNSLLGTYYYGNYSESKSFLEIKVDKQIYKNGKGRGKLTGLWSFFHSGTRGNKGFVTFNEAKTSDSGQKLDLIGGFYTTMKRSSDNKGVVGYRKEVKEQDNKALDKRNFDRYFPKPYGYTKQGGFDKYWYNNGGFMNGASDLDKICKEDDADCNVSERSISDTLKWEGYADSGYSSSRCDNWPFNVGCDYIGNWSGDINSKSELQGYDYMYGKVGNLNLRDHLDPFNRGAWRPIPRSKGIN